MTLALTRCTDKPNDVQIFQFSADQRTVRVSVMTS